MSDTVIVAIIGLAGSAFGSFVGIAVNSRMMSYRLEQLERRFDELVNKQTAAEARISALESKNALQDEKIRAINEKIADLERKVES